MNKSLSIHNPNMHRKNTLTTAIINLAIMSGCTTHTIIQNTATELTINNKTKQKRQEVNDPQSKNSIKTNIIDAIAKINPKGQVVYYSRENRSLTIMKQSIVLSDANGDNIGSILLENDGYTIVYNKEFTPNSILEQIITMINKRQPIPKDQQAQ